MITFLYLNSEDGIPQITTCPFNKLIKEGKGYISNCGAEWWSVSSIQDKHNYEDIIKLLSSINFDEIPPPKGYEVIELKFKPLEYNIVSDEEGN